MKSIDDDQLFARFHGNPPANGALIDQFQARVPFRLPDDYVRFLRRMNGGEGFVGKNYLRLWPVEELVKYNMHYRGNEEAPGLFLFGTVGGGGICIRHPVNSFADPCRSLYS